MKEQFTTTVRVKGKGESKARAFSDALNHVQAAVMKAENATFGISFCGSGGAGAITAQNKHGYKAKYGMRSVEEGVTAINEGCNVLGFGFMDKEELGERLVQAWQKKYGA